MMAYPLSSDPSKIIEKKTVSNRFIDVSGMALAANYRSGRLQMGMVAKRAPW
jgi:hypothetical protein